MNTPYKTLLKEWQDRRQKILEAKLSGKKQIEIAKEFKVSAPRINAIIKRALKDT